MFGFGGSSKHARYGVIFDISSGSVGVGVIELTQEQKLPKVIFSHRVNMRIGKSNIEAGERLRQMRETLFSASLIVSRDGLQALSAKNSRARISKIFLVCSSPWAHTISRDVAYEDDEDFIITSELINDLALSAEREIESQLGSPEMLYTSGYEVVERATVDVRVNGYSVHNPLGLSGKTLSLSHVTGFILKDIIDAVSEVRDKIFTDTDIQAHTAMLVSYCVYRDLFPNVSELTLVNVTGEATEIGLIEEGILLETHSVLYVSNTLIREIAEKTDHTPEHIISMLRSYSENTLNDTNQTTTNSYAAIYDEKLIEIFKTIHARRNIPRMIIVNADTSIEEFAKARILKNAGEVTGQKFTVLHIKKDTLEHIAEEDNSDVRISIQSRFFHKLHGCGEMEAT